ncbi:DNA-directed RNA polymerase subunit beta [Evansella tamaricis]|uniref:DNA-directed RNA polymerase subunit beta n=1 Tax=Evansella tamaricis TaxID=2069301 RepID=A0ABS6JA91_9BACI|nr:DNA-directed RNA polymerase subunit beta [Evansella tamaricis]MBU9710597.1 DNA-directed RNA polymerase subunit beta [Evansella tamaricis]
MSKDNKNELEHNRMDNKIDGNSELTSQDRPTKEPGGSEPGATEPDKGLQSDETEQHDSSIQPDSEKTSYESDAKESYVIGVGQADQSESESRATAVAPEKEELTEGESDTMSESKSRRQRRLQREVELEDETDELEETDETDEGRMAKRKKFKGRIRLIPVWIKVIFVLCLFAGSLVVGAMFGFAIVGEGLEFRDVLDKETWYRVYDLIYADTEMDRSGWDQ